MSEMITLPSNSSSDAHGLTQNRHIMNEIATLPSYLLSDTKQFISEMVTLPSYSSSDTKQTWVKWSRYLHLHRLTQNKTYYEWKDHATFIFIVFVPIVLLGHGIHGTGSAIFVDEAGLPLARSDIQSDLCSALLLNIKPAIGLRFSMLEVATLKVGPVPLLFDVQDRAQDDEGSQDNQHASAGHRKWGEWRNDQCYVV